MENQDEHENIQLNPSTSNSNTMSSIDYVLIFSNHPDDSGTFERHEIVRKQFLENLSQEGLEWEIDRKRDVSAVKIHATIETLRKYCELLRWQMPANHRLLSKYEATEAEKKHSYFDKTCTKYKIHYYYSQELSYLFKDNDPNFFTSGFRTLVVHYILERTKFNNQENGEESPTKKDLYTIGIQKLIHDQVFLDGFPLHDGDARDDQCLRGKLLKNWGTVLKWKQNQPIEDIKEYFGVQIAIYYAWLGFYTIMLIPAAIIGIVCLSYGGITMFSSELSEEICNKTNDILFCPLCDKHCDYWRLQDTCTYSRITNLFDNDFTVIFAILMCLWTTVFLELWKRYSAHLVHNWGLTDYTKRVEPRRPDYLEFLRKNGGVEKTATCSAHPPRLIRYVYTYSVTILFICLVLITTFGVIVYRMSLNAADSFYGQPDSIIYKITILPATGAVINLIAIKILSYFYYHLAIFLTEKELHRTQGEYDESLSLKIYLFQFFNNYSSIFYIALLKGKHVGYPGKYNRIFDFRQEECGPNGCMLELCIQLVIIMVGKQIWYTIQEILWEPFWSLLFGIMSTVKQCMKKTQKERSNERWFKDNKLYPLTFLTLFYEYLEMIIQFGFVTLFTVAFPLAPLFALLNNVVELRYDARKFLLYYRRPIPKRARNIGMWLNILNIICRLSVLTNAAIIAFSSNFIPKLVYHIVEKIENIDTTYLNFTLAEFATKDFEKKSILESTSFNNTEICYYNAFRYPPNSPHKYNLTPMYWHVLAARLAFIVVFQNFVGFVQLFVDWVIPDIPMRVKQRVRQEQHLITEIIREGKFGKLCKYVNRMRPKQQLSVPVGNDDFKINVELNETELNEINSKDDHVKQQ